MMNFTIAEQTTKSDYLPIELESFRIDSVLEFDLYIKIQNKMVLYRSADLPFTDNTRVKLLENRVEELFITPDCYKKYQSYVEKNLELIVEDPEIYDIKKANILYKTSTSLVKDVLADPYNPEIIERSIHLVRQLVQFILIGRDAFLSLMKVTSFDYHNYTHSVNVCIFSLGLAQQMNYDDPEFLFELGVGSLLHDVGKSKVSQRILNKRNSLNSIEFEIMKKHPKWGVEILKETNLIPKASYYPIEQHHERGDRSGYPDGLNLNEMHIYSKIVSIADSFDAMTTERVYQQALGSFPALQIMFSLKGMFDEELMRAFVTLMGPTEQNDPE